MENSLAAYEVSVVILTFNGAAYLAEVLDRVFTQRASFAYEVLIIDSGSSDGGLEIAEKFTGRDIPLRILKIPSAEFNHGGTRNLGVKETTGKYIAFLTQDATPAGDNWLALLRACFEKNMDIAAVFGKHIPRSDCNPITKRDIEGVFLNISPNGSLVVQSVATDEEREQLMAGLGPLGFYSDVNSCLRRDYWEKHPYPEVDYAEDQIFGREVLLNGFKKAYCPDAAVYHSHNYPPREFKARYFDEYRGLNKAVGYRDDTSLWAVVPKAAKGAFRDARMIAGSGQAGDKGRLYWLRYAWRMNYARGIGAYFGSRHAALPSWLTRRLSLEEKQKVL